MTIHDMAFRPASPSCSSDCHHCAQAWRSALGRLVKANRRKRKARKNLAMYKLAGRRPWDCGPFGEVLDSLTRHLGDGQRLRERSGFAAMSRLASMLVDHELQSSTVCDRCKGEGKGKSRDGQWICLKCNGFGHNVVLRRRAEGMR